MPKAIDPTRIYHGPNAIVAALLGQIGHAPTTSDPDHDRIWALTGLS